MVLISELGAQIPVFIQPGCQEESFEGPVTPHSPYWWGCLFSELAVPESAFAAYRQRTCAGLESSPKADLRRFGERERIGRFACTLQRSKEAQCKLRFCCSFHLPLCQALRHTSFPQKTARKPLATVLRCRYREAQAKELRVPIDRCFASRKLVPSSMQRLWHPVFKALIGYGPSSPNPDTGPESGKQMGVSSKLLIRTPAL